MPRFASLLALSEEAVAFNDTDYDFIQLWWLRGHIQWTQISFFHISSCKTNISIYLYLQMTSYVSWCGGISINMSQVSFLYLEIESGVQNSMMSLSRASGLRINFFFFESSNKIIFKKGKKEACLQVYRKRRKPDKKKWFSMKGTKSSRTLWVLQKEIKKSLFLKCTKSLCTLSKSLIFLHVWSM